MAQEISMQSPSKPPPKQPRSTDRQKPKEASVLTVERQELGNRLYLKVCAKLHELRMPGKVTGMLFELSDEEISKLIDNTEALEEKIFEAISVFGEYRAAQNLATKASVLSL